MFGSPIWTPSSAYSDTFKPPTIPPWSFDTSYGFVHLSGCVPCTQYITHIRAASNDVSLQKSQQQQRIAQHMDFHLGFCEGQRMQQAEAEELKRSQQAQKELEKSLQKWVVRYEKLCRRMIEKDEEVAELRRELTEATQRRAGATIPSLDSPVRTPASLSVRSPLTASTVTPAFGLTRAESPQLPKATPRVEDYTFSPPALPILGRWSTSSGDTDVDPADLVEEVFNAPYIPSSPTCSERTLDGHDSFLDAITPITPWKEAEDSPVLPIRPYFQLRIDTQRLSVPTVASKYSSLADSPSTASSLREDELLSSALTAPPLRMQSLFGTSPPQVSPDDEHEERSRQWAAPIPVRWLSDSDSDSLKTPSPEIFSPAERLPEIFTLDSPTSSLSDDSEIEFGRIRRAQPNFDHWADAVSDVTKSPIGMPQSGFQSPTEALPVWPAFQAATAGDSWAEYRSPDTAVARLQRSWTNTPSPILSVPLSSPISAVSPPRDLLTIPTSTRHSSLFLRTDLSPLSPSFGHSALSLRHDPPEPQTPRASDYARRSPFSRASSIRNSPLRLRPEVLPYQADNNLFSAVDTDTLPVIRLDTSMLTAPSPTQSLRTPHPLTPLPGADGPMNFRDFRILMEAAHGGDSDALGQVRKILAAAHETSKGMRTTLQRFALVAWRAPGFPLPPLAQLPPDGNYVDASTSWGVGFVSDGEWLAWKFKKDWNMDPSRDILWAEFVAVEMGLHALVAGGRRNERVTMFSDNMTVVQTIASKAKTRKVDAQDEVIQRIREVLKQHSLVLDLQWVPTRRNAADGPSRGRYPDAPIRKRSPRVPASLSQYLESSVSF